jgi:acyl-CoA thioester hydrolase
VEPAFESRLMPGLAKDESAAIPPRALARLQLRVYYEDTDFSGYVYHASYLRFLERARTEWLRALGFAQGDLKQEDAVTFAVRRIEIDYLNPARMDDSVIVETRLRRLGGASVDFEQTIARGSQTLVSAFVGRVLLKNGRPARMPNLIRDRIAAAKDAAESIPPDFERSVEPRDD